MNQERGARFSVKEVTPPTNGMLRRVQRYVIGIRTRLIISFLLVTVVPLIYVSWVFLRSATDNLFEVIMKQSMTSARKASLELIVHFDAQKRLLTDMASTARTAAAAGRLQNWMKETVAGNVSLERLQLRNNSSEVIALSSGQARDLPLDGAETRKRLENHTLSLESIPTDNNHTLIAASVPTHGPDGQVDGLLTAELNQLKLVSLLSENLSGQTARLHLLDANRQIVLSYPEQANALDADLLQRVIRGSRYGVYELSGKTLREPLLAVYLPVAGTGWKLLLVQRQEEVYSLLLSFRRNLFVVLGFTVLFAVALGLLIARNIAIPILTVAQGTHELAAGRLDVRIRMKRGDEVGQLAENFNSMADSLEAKVAELETAYSSLQEHAQTIEETNRVLDRKVFEIGTLYDVGRRMGEVGIDMDRLLDVILDKALQAADAERGSLMLLDDDDQLRVQRVRLLDAQSRESRPLEEFRRNIQIAPGEGVAGRVLQSGEMCVINRPGEDPQFKPYDDATLEAPRQLVCVPLKIKGNVFGVINIANRLNGEEFTSQDTELLSTLARQAAMALQNARLFRLAITDGLTELFMRRHFLNRLEEEIKRARRYKSRFSVLFMDVDHFKKFNDTYGHQQGDLVLKYFAQNIRDCMRTDIDIPARYGGEEFIVLLPETDCDGALLAAERLRRQVEEFEFPYDKGAPLHVTTSIGISTYPDHGQDGLELIRKADTALYQAKETGRNKVCGWTESMGVVEET